MISKSAILKQIRTHKSAVMPYIKSTAQYNTGCYDGLIADHLIPAKTLATLIGMSTKRIDAMQRKIEQKRQDSTKYNGYTNYESWAVALWIDNNQHFYNTVRELVQEWKTEFEYKSQIDSALASWVEENMISAQESGLGSDLLGAALSSVDWHELVDNYLSEE